MNRTLHYLILALFLTNCDRNPGKTPEEKIDYLITKAHENGEFEGSVLVGNKGQIIYQKHIGMADAEHGIPVTDSTRFLIASVSKPITAILILQLVEQEKIRLSDSLSAFFNTGTDPRASKVTIHQLLTHTSGIEELIKEDHLFAGADLRSAEFNFEPGTDFEYSNTGYVILKEIAERTSGLGFEELIRQQICERGQLSSLGVARNLSEVSNLALGYTNIRQDDPIAIGYPLETVDGAGSLYATVKDLYQLDRALYSDQLLSKESVDLMQRQHVKERFGYGWFLRERSGIWDVTYHAGNLPGYSSYFSRRTKMDEVIVLLSNVEGLDLSDLERDISKVLQFDNE